MTYQEHYTLPADLLELLQQDGLAALPEALSASVITSLICFRSQYASALI